MEIIEVSGYITEEKIEIAKRQVLVYFFQREERLYRGCPFVETAYYRICRREPHTTLKAIKLKQHDKADDL